MVGFIPKLIIKIPHDALSASMGTVESGGMKDEVRKHLLAFEKKSYKHHVTKFDHEARDAITYFKERYKDGAVEFKKCTQGVTDTQIVLVNGTAKHILKKTSLPQQLFGHRWGDVQQYLRNAEGKTLEDKVEDLFFKNPARMLPSEYTYANNFQREKIASICGEILGISVPKVDTLRTDQGSYTIHEFVESLGDSLECDIAAEKNQSSLNLQSLQDIGVLDILLENDDRHPGNILVVKKDLLTLIPIDHALTLQKKDFKLITSLNRYKPCWFSWDKASEPLTAKTRNNIKELDARDILSTLEKQGIEIDDKIVVSIVENVLSLKELVQNNPEISLKGLYLEFLKSH